MPRIFRPGGTVPLLQYLFEVMPDTPKTRVRQWLKHGSVSVNGKITTQFDHPLDAGDEVGLAKEKMRAVTPALQFNLQIVHEDDSLLVIDKPAGLLTIGSEKVPRESAIYALNDYLNKKSAALKKGLVKKKKMVFVVHRIDRDVSGLVLFAKNEKTKFAMQEDWENVRKEYLAVVEGCPEKPRGTVESYLTENRILRVFSGPRTRESRKAVTHYEVLESGQGYSLLKIVLETGRKHQIRVHMADLGHPIAGDTDYGAKKSGLKRIALHAAVLEFDHPVTGRKCSFSSPLPAEIRRLVLSPCC